MFRLRQVELLSIAIPLAVLMALIGFCTGIVYLVGGIFYDIFITGTVNSSTFGKFLLLLPLRFSVLIVMPVVSGAFGFLVGLFGAILNNLLVKILGKR